MSFRPCCIIPSRNHHLAVGGVVARAHACGLPVFLIDDASAEPARGVLAGLHDPASGVRVTRLEQRGGKGGAVRRGFELAAAAGFTHAVQLDADGQHDLARLPALLAAAENAPDAVIAGEARYDASIPRARLWGRWLTHVSVWIETLSLDISDSLCGFRCYPLAPSLRLCAGGKVGGFMDFDVEILVRLYWQGIEVVMFPIDVTYPVGNTSNFDVLRDNWRITKMHTRLTLGMLPRLPMLLMRRMQRAARAS